MTHTNIIGRGLGKFERLRKISGFDKFYGLGNMCGCVDYYRFVGLSKNSEYFP